MTDEYSLVDLFCGIGGLSHGFYKEKFRIAAGVDIDSTCQYAYEQNNKASFYSWDLNVRHSADIASLFEQGKKKILVGCAPCQAFSPLSNRYKENEKWKMLYTFSRIIRDVRPEIVSMENVPNLKNYRGGKVLEDFILNLKHEGYYVHSEILNCAEIGMAQKRKRFILLASRLGPISFVLPQNKRRRTVRNVIGKLPEILAGEIHFKDPLHRARSLSELNMRRIKVTPESGSWKDWPKELILECHKKESGKSFGSVYGRMSWDDASPTMTTQCTGLGNGRFGHPDQDRAISLREAALLQSFPMRYKFVDPDLEFSVRRIETHIGNAVPVMLGSIIAKSIAKHIEIHG